MNNLKKAVPEFVAKIKELAAIYDVEWLEFEKIYTEIERLKNNTSITESDIEGIEKWEELYGIAKIEGATLEERRFNLISRINEKTPFTYRNLENILKSLTGKGNYTLYFDDDYSLSVILFIRGMNFDNLYKNLQKMLPVNIQLNFTAADPYMYIWLHHYYTYDALKDFTYNQLNAYA